MKLAANLSLLWQELPFFDRFDAAAAAGFEAVEVHYPYEFGAQAMQKAMRRTGLRMLLINAPPPNYTGGPMGYAARPDGQARFQHDMRRVFRYADVLGTNIINVVPGPGAGQDSFDVLVENLKWASKAAPKGLILTIEPMNDTDVPGYFLNDFGLAAQVLDAVKKSNVRLLFDCYHAQTIHGDVFDTWYRYGLRAAHVQIADVPKRGEPGTGKLDYPELIRKIINSGYKNWFSAEYAPATRQTEDSLRWMKKLRAAAEK